jgi:cytochrome c-type biogenesis protein CcmH
MYKTLGCFLSLLLMSGSLQAAIETYTFQNDEQRERYQLLSEELRCPKCQNQNLADSDSQIAADLRKELHAQLIMGKPDDAIIDFMRERYGDFVLYKPRLQSSTLALWLGPVGLMMGVLAGLIWSRRSGKRGDKVEPLSVNSPATAVASPTPSVLVKKKNFAVVVVSLLALLMVGIGSLVLYQQLGSMQAQQITVLSEAVFSGQLSAEQLTIQRQQLLNELDDLLVGHPEQDKFRYMRARLLADSGLWERAGADYRELIAHFPDQDTMLAEYAQVLFLQNQRVLGSDAAALLQQALQVNPHNITALGLLGMQAFQTADYAAAVAYWQRLMPGLPASSMQAETIQAGITQARKLGNLPDNAAAVATVSPSDTIPAAGAGDVRFQVQVTLANVVKPESTETVFVFLRAVNGPRMPLAVVKTTVSGLSQPLLLDTASSPMRGQVDLAAVERFQVVARLSRSGQPQAAAGDWEGRIDDLDRQKLSSQPLLPIEINQASAP